MEAHNPVHQPAVVRGRLGVIGGQKKLARPAASNGEVTEDLAVRYTKLSERNEGDKRTGDNEDSDQLDGPRKEALTTPMIRRETSIERANRKREELRRELEHRAPVRKKRKF